MRAPFAMPSSTTARCFAVGEGSTVLRSGGGSNWSAQAAPGEPRRYFAVACPSQSECLAVGDFGSWAITSNGGQTWQNAGGGDFIHPFGVGCAGSSTCLVVGSEDTHPAYDDATAGLFVVTDTRGANHGFPDNRPVHASDAQRFDTLNAVACPSGNRCFSVGNHGEIISASNAYSKMTDQFNEPLMKGS